MWNDFQQAGHAVWRNPVPHTTSAQRQARQEKLLRFLESRKVESLSGNQICFTINQRGDVFICNKRI